MVSEDKFLNYEGLSYLWNKVRDWVSGAFRKVSDLIGTDDLADETVTTEKINSEAIATVDETLAYLDIPFEGIASQPRFKLVTLAMSKGSVSVNGTYTSEATLPSIAGYEYAAISSFSTSSGGCVVVAINKSDNVLRMLVRNVSSSVVDVTPAVVAMYVKT